MIAGACNLFERNMLVKLDHFPQGSGGEHEKKEATTVT